MYCKLLIACLLATISFVQCYPTHASCKLTWKFNNANWTFVGNSLANEFKILSGTDCGDGEKCRYKLTSQTDTEIKGTHTTPVHLYVDDLTFTLQSTGTDSCTVEAFSTSETWYAYLDYGTNYCNLRNLADGAGITSATYGFSEQTSNSICTQYTSHNCDKY